MLRPVEFPDVEACVDAILEKVGNELRVGAPLGAGKPNHLLNAIYQRARENPEIKLTIYTALTLQRPAGKSLLEERFLEPFAKRVFGDYPDLDFELDRVAGKLPDNIDIVEFYMPPGKFVGNTHAQRNYISSNYTHVARDLDARKINVAVQQVAERTTDDGTSLSLSCNPDVAPDIVRMMRSRERNGEQIAVVAQINSNLPFMFDDAELQPAFFDFIVRNPAQEYRIFGPPKMPVTDADHMIGLYVSSLIKDGGELQIGIGAIGDAVVHGLSLRQQHNAIYEQAFTALGAGQRFAATIDAVGGLTPFYDGVFVASEMLIDGFLTLMDAGVVKRMVYDDLAIQRLLNEGRITETVDMGTLDALLDVQAIRNPWNAADVEYLHYFGVLDEMVRYVDGAVVLPDGSTHPGDLSDTAFRQTLEQRGLGTTLKNGALVHASFFLGPQVFYERLRQMSDDARRQIRMRTVTRVNDFFGSEEIDRLHRRDARCINTAMKMSLLGAATSDGLDSGQIVSGVGGQYNFVAMAHELEGGRSIINLRAVAERDGALQSNIVWNYGHVTIPRHLRDIVVTEYGIADLRGKTDEETIQALLNIADSRFQPKLLAQAKAAGKLRADYQIPDLHRQNLPERYAQVLQGFKTGGAFARFPLGTDFTDQELTIAKALKSLKKKTSTTSGKLSAIVAGFLRGGAGQDVEPYLERMHLTKPKTSEEKLYARILTAELRRSA